MSFAKNFESKNYRGQNIKHEPFYSYHNMGNRTYKWQKIHTVQTVYVYLHI